MKEINKPTYIFEESDFYKQGQIFHYAGSDNEIETLCSAVYYVGQNFDVWFLIDLKTMLPLFDTYDMQEFGYDSDICDIEEFTKFVNEKLRGRLRPVTQEEITEFFSNWELNYDITNVGSNHMMDTIPEGYTLLTKRGETGEWYDLPRAGGAFKGCSYHDGKWHPEELISYDHKFPVCTKTKSVIKANT